MPEKDKPEVVIGGRSAGSILSTVGNVWGMDANRGASFKRNHKRLKATHMRANSQITELKAALDSALAGCEELQEVIKSLELTLEKTSEELAYTTAKLLVVTKTPLKEADNSSKGVETVQLTNTKKSKTSPNKEPKVKDLSMKSVTTPKGGL